MQSKKNSFVEAVANTLVGFVVNFVATYFVVAPLLHIHIDLFQNTGIVFVSSLGTILKNYFVRRYFVIRERNKTPKLTVNK